MQVMALSVVKFGFPARGSSLCRVFLSLTSVVLQLCSLLTRRIFAWRPMLTARLPKGKG